MARNVGEYAECDADESAVAGGHAVHSVVEIGAVRHGSGHNNDHQHKHHPTGSLFVLAEKTNQVGVVEIVVLDERNRGLGAFHRLTFVDDFHLVSHFGALHIFANHGIGTQIEREAHDESHDDLAQNLVASGQTLLVLLENLDVVVEKPDGTEPNCGADHEKRIDIAQSAEEQCGNQDSQNDDEATHRGNPHFVHTEGVDIGVASGFTDVTALHPFDEILAEPHGNDEAENQCQERTEGNVAPKG